MSYDNTNRGAIWKNDRKETENHPDFTGTLNVDGKDYWVSAWKRKPDAKEGSPALSFSVKVKEPRSQSNPGGGGGRGPSTMDDDDIPFITNGGDW